MSGNTPQILFLSLAVTLALSACIDFEKRQLGAFCLSGL